VRFESEFWKGFEGKDGAYLWPGLAAKFNVQGKKTKVEAKDDQAIIIT
jgi:hypothetical protein